MSAISESILPWGVGDPDPNTVYLIPIDIISIPALRVTSTFAPEQLSELVESLKTEGQRDPVKCVWSNKQVILSDGFNRIVGLKQLAVEVVKALVRPGSIADVQIENVITARHRGKENPAQTAEVIKDLIEVEHLDKSEVKQRLGLTDATFRRLYAISALPQEVKDHIKYSRLGVGAAYHISQLSESSVQITLASQAVNWGYTEDQVKSAVIQLLNPDADKSTQPYVFSDAGKPVIVYPKCAGCNVELQAFICPLNCCQECYEAAKMFFQTYFASDTTLIPGSDTTSISPPVDSGFIRET